MLKSCKSSALWFIGPFSAGGASGCCWTSGSATLASSCTGASWAAGSGCA